MKESFMEKAAQRLNSIRVWKKGCTTPFKKFRFSVMTFVLSLFFENFMTLCVTVNTIGLAIEHYG